jgi:glycosyltransferase involved in cell wall biosynthesis
MSLAKAMVSNHKEHEFILVLNGLFVETIEPIRAEFDSILSQNNIRVWSAAPPVCAQGIENTWRRRSAELVREAFIESLAPDVIYLTSLFEGYGDNAVTSIGRFDKKTPVTVTIFDLIPLLNPAQYLEPNESYQTYYLKKIDFLRKSSCLFAISEASKIEALEHLNFDSELIVNISTAADSLFQPLSLSQEQKRNTLNKFGIIGPFLLYSGGGDERKNLRRLLNAYAQLPYEIRSVYQLVFAGKIPNSSQFQDEAATAGLSQQELIFTGYIPDDDLVKLYNLSALYVFPSWHEGFGLPALEAMSCGTPVIGANTSSLPEVIGNKEALFDPYSVKNISNKIAEVLSDDVLQKDLVTKGLEQSKLYSWDITAQRAIESLLAFENSDVTVHSVNINSIKSRLINAIVDQHQEPSGPSDKDLLSLAQSVSLTFGDNRSARIFIDVSQLIIADFKTGIQRVVRSVSKEWLTASIDGWEVEPIYLADDDSRSVYRYATDFKSSQLVSDRILSHGIVEPQYGDIFLGLDLCSSVLEPIENGVFSEWKARGVKIHFVVYDVLPIFHPQWWPKGGSELHTQWLTGIATVSDSLISISKAVSDDVQLYLRDNPVERSRPLSFSWFHLGGDVENSDPSTGFPDDAQDILTLLNNRTTFLSVGTIEPRKGHMQTLEAFELLWTNDVDVNFVVVGKEGWLVEELIAKIKSHPELGQRLFWFDGISDEYLTKIYSASRGLISASEGEGFGLPLIEAAQHGLPIIARDIPVFREVAGEQAFYFSGLTAADLVVAIQDWLTLYNENRPPESSSMHWLTWSESAGKLLQCIGIEKNANVHGIECVDGEA